ncbi:MAG: EF-hand domain-containing protein [Pseudomonadota bacterium]
MTGPVRTFLTATLLTAALAGGAVAQDASATFRTADTDGSGTLNKAEMDAHLQAVFAARDNDGDGVITAEEIASALPSGAANGRAERIEAMVSRRDKNGDGGIAFDELVPAGYYQRADVNQDNVVSRDEWDGLPLGPLFKGGRG